MRNTLILGVVALCILGIVFLSVWPKRESGARSATLSPRRSVLPKDAGPKRLGLQEQSVVPTDQDRPEPPATEAAHEPDASAPDALRDTFYRLEDALRTPSAYDQVPRLLAKLLLLAQGPADRQWLMKELRNRLGSGERDDLVVGFLAFAVGALGDSVRLSDFPRDSAALKLYLMGSRFRLQGESEGRSVSWSEETLTHAVRGAILTMEGLGGAKDLVTAQMPGADRNGMVIVTKERFNAVDFHFWSKPDGVRPLSEDLLTELLKLLAERGAVGESTRRWIAERVLQRGRLSREESGFAASWLMIENDPSTRRWLLRPGLPLDDADLRNRVKDLVVEGKADAIDALRLLLGHSRAETRKIVLQRYEELVAEVRAAASREMLFRLGNRAWDHFGQRWQAEENPSVLKAIIHEVHRQGLPSARDQEAAALLRFGLAHEPLLQSLLEDSAHAKAAAAWLQFMGGR